MKRGLQWPIGMAVILALTVAVNIWVMRVAGADPSFVVEKDYYAKAVQWDSTMAQERRNAQLGWSLRPVLGDFEPETGALLTVTLTDSTGMSIADAKVRVVALYNARAGDLHEALLAADGAGGYSAMLPVAHAGQWEFRFVSERGHDRFTAVERVEASRRAPSGKAGS